MSNEATIQFRGNAGADAELQFGQSGQARVTVNVAVTPRVKTNGEWADGETAWYRVTHFGRDAEAIAEQVRKGTTVVVTGRLTPRAYTTKAGEPRTSLDVVADHLGVIPRATAMRPATGQPDPFTGYGSGDQWGERSGAGADSPPF